MAVGDINFKVRGESPLVGGGFNASGSPVQAKKLVWGRIEVTSYAAAGMDMQVEDLRLTSIDYLHMQVLTIDDNDDGTFTWPSSTVHYDAQWADGTDKLFITIDEAEGTKMTDEGVATINFIAIGDHSGAPDLL
jgi:acyl-CoA hydrolase